MNISIEKINTIISDTIYKQMKCGDEKIIIIYDEDSPLSKIISQSYKEVLADRENTEIILYHPDKNKELAEKLLQLDEGSSVFLVQSTSFRMDDFRIRLQLYNRKVGCMEHSHLSYYPENQEETVLNALQWNGEEYFRLGSEIKNLMEESDSINIYSGKDEKLVFPDMDEGKINDGRFYAQKNRGGSSICGEIFSEAKDLRSVNGTLSICCYPNSQFRIIQCEPFIVTIKNGCITEVSDNAPEEFRENILKRVLEGGEVNEEGEPEIMIREAGFGLNPNISFEKPLTYVSIFERQAGFHVSVGKKHEIYRKKLGKKIIQRFHIDIFSDCKKMTAEKDGKEIVFFENGKYIL